MSVAGWITIVFSVFAVFGTGFALGVKVGSDIWKKAFQDVGLLK
jgi:hypothetical protein